MPVLDLNIKNFEKFYPWQNLLHSLLRGSFSKEAEVKSNINMG